MAERSFTKEVESLRLGQGMEFRGEGILAVTKALLQAGVAYVGHEREYQHYQQLAIQQQIAQDYYMAATMPPMYARGWYGAWGPSIWW